MKITPFWASIALVRAPAVLAQATTTSLPSTTTSAVPSCTASLITSLCSYKEPDPEFAVAESRTSCWAYCNTHPPCDFVIFAAGNPYTDSGTCWLYPGETFDKSAGSSDCGSPSLSVYSKPECAGTPTSGACTATASPSAIASVCGYPAPETCFDTCAAAGGASACLSQCAEADSCSYAVFNPSDSSSPYAPGNCWVYTNGTYDAKSVTACSGEPKQFVYENPCPKSSSSSSPSPLASPSSNGSSPSATATTNSNGVDAKAATQGTATSKDSSAPPGLSISNLLAVGMVVLMQQGL